MSNLQITHNSEWHQLVLKMVTAYSLRRHACFNSQSTSNLATIPMPPHARHVAQIHFNCTPLTLRAHLATMRAPRPAKAETLGSHPSMISNRGWSLSMISTALRSRRSTNTKNDGGGPILASRHSTESRGHSRVGTCN